MGLGMSGFDRYGVTGEMTDVAPRTRRFSPRASVSWTVWLRLARSGIAFTPST